MFDKILIANRGEIALRVMATARRMGIRTVAVYSDADAEALHVQAADEAVRIGPAPVAESYLRGDAIIAAALATGAKAIHPGYGFLSENPDFVDAVAAAGLIFIGPNAAAIRAMGLKDAAKSLMQAAGVPVVPGYHGINQDPDHLAAQAGLIGYPVLIKARAGGGGKGMRLVERAQDFHSALQGAQREGLASFGDASVLIERFVTNPRHIEMQVFGDNHGNVVHLFERDCSLQRRYQKVIEESPAPGMTDEVRAAMGHAAVEAARAIGYSGAGTVEFIAEGTLRPDGFWFMEMNTRLQVEHPVSEAITGLDFVELQLQVAAGQPLPFGQDDLKITGHAFEARLYAEDVAKGFLPATGRLEHLHFPAAARFERAALRIDAGVRQGDQVSPWYDPMIAKVITHGPNRRAALDQLRHALGGVQVAGLTTNLAFLRALTRHAGFAAGQVDIGLIGRDLDLLLAETPPSAAIVAMALLAAADVLPQPASDDPWMALAQWRHWSPDRHFAELDLGETRLTGYLTALSAQDWQAVVDGQTLTLGVTAQNGGYVLRDGDHSFRVEIVQSARGITLFAQGRDFVFTRPKGVEVSDTAQAQDRVTAPMPGQVKLVCVAAGDAIEKGQPLIVLEAMKMEHTLRASGNGIVSEVLVAQGDQVDDGVLLLRLDAADV